MLFTIIDSLLLKDGYTFLNTFIYSVIIVSVFFLLFKYFNKKININFSFVRTTIPFLLFGACLRIFEQEGFFSNTFVFFLKVPGLLIFLVFLYMFFFIIIFNFFKKRYHFYLETVGYFLFVFLFIYICTKTINWFYFFLILLFVFILCFLFFYIFKKLFKEKTNKFVLFSQTLDAVATTFGIFFLNDFLKEAHFLSSLLISASPCLFLIIKIAVVIFFIYFVDNNVGDRHLRIYIKLLIIIHGLLIGFRTLLTISLF
jgi:uncharacterized membrane protein